MSTYGEVLSQAQSLTPEEQQQLLEVLSALMRDRATTHIQGSSERLPRKVFALRQVDLSCSRYLSRLVSSTLNLLVCYARLFSQ